MDAIVNQISGILSVSVCGVSVATIIGMIIYCAKVAATNKKNLTVTTETIKDILERVEKGEQMILKILVLFTHFQKLPDSTKEEIEDFVNKETNTIETKL